MSAPFSNTRLRVPHGFQNILECFSREVLRMQPSDIFKFGMEYFDYLLRLRRETGEKDVTQLGAALEDRYYNNRSFMTPSANIKTEGEKEENLKSETKNKTMDFVRNNFQRAETVDATIIQAGTLSHLPRQKRSNSQSSIQTDKFTRKGKSSEGLTDIEAAIIIQASVRSYLVRQKLLSLKTSVTINSEKPLSEKPHERIERSEINYTETQEDYNTEKKIIDSLIETQTVHEDTNAKQLQVSDHISMPDMAESLYQKNNRNKNENSIDLSLIETHTVLEDKTEKELTISENLIVPDKAELLYDKDIRNEKENSVDLNMSSEEEINIDLTDPKVEKAAVKIQAQYSKFKKNKIPPDENVDDKEEPLFKNKEHSAEY